MVRCALKSCGITLHAVKNLSESVSLHRFPKDAAIRKRWTRFCDRADLDDTKEAHLCSQHFVKHDYENVYMEGARKILRKNAVPSIREPHSTDQPGGGSPQDRSEIVSELLREHDESMGQYAYHTIKTREVDIPSSSIEIEDSSASYEGFSNEVIIYPVDTESLMHPAEPPLEPVNRCVVPNCKNILQEWFALFPENGMLMSRWRECIEVGSGHLLPSMAQFRKKGIMPVVCSMHFLGFDPNDPPCYRQPTLFFREDIVVEVERCCMCNGMHIKETMVEKDATFTKKFTIQQLATSYFGPSYFDDNATAEYLCEECIVKLDMMYKYQRQIIAAKQHHIDLRYRKSKEKIAFQQNRFEQGVILPDETMAEVVMDILSSKVENEPEEQSPVSAPGIVQKQPKSKYSLDPEAKRKLEQSRLTCFLCNTIYETSPLLLSHLMMTHVDGEFQCSECNVTFKASPELNAHLARHDPKSRPFQCNFCPLRFSRDSGKTKHEADYHLVRDVPKVRKPREKKFVCPDCGKTFRDRTSMNRHEQFQHKGEPVAHCNVCLKPFASRRNLKRHLQLVHRGERPYQCKYCQITYKQSQELLDHVNENHREEKLKEADSKLDAPPNYTCNVCSEKFVSRRLLFLHKRKHSTTAIHSNTKIVNVLVRRDGGESSNQLVCKLCEALFPKGTEIIEHFQTVHPDTTLEYHLCSQCGEVYFSKHQYLIHSYKHTDKYACDQCGKRHINLIRLQMHKNVHHGVPLAKQFLRECPYCHKEITKGSYYSRHIKTHFENQWACEVCDKSYLQKWQLNVHKRTHTGEKPLVCAGCASKFSDPTTFCKHKKNCLSFKNKETNKNKQ